jgi:chromosome segregation protein
MRVKRLEILGFKSFKDKTVIHFDHSITGIVGPNGCGKSNIVDAFFWVMGEQSYKHIRGSGSDDLIFNGSSKYSPLGVAEATLVMETDVPDSENAPAGATVQDVPIHLRAKEVSVTRRVYRSGEGEYFINGVPARLKDIHELFMDTGVGAKGYSVIEQGQIGKVVNAKPEERRLLIEEAAGIAKYKARKKESLRKMEATQANLSRLNDVIQEIERSLASLERQAQKARLYRKYKDELLDKEMTWGRRKAQVLRQKLEAVRAQRDALEQELAGLRAEVQVAENQIEVDRVAQLTASKEAEERQQRIQALSGDLAREKSALDLSRRRQGDLASQLAALGMEKNELETAIAADRERLAAQEREAADADTFLQTASERAQAMDAQARAGRDSAESARRELEDRKRRLMSDIAAASDLASRAAALSSRMESAIAQADRLTQQEQALADKVAAARAEAERLRAAAGELKGRRDALQAERRGQAEEVQAREQAVREAERAHADFSRQLTQQRSRLQSLEELAAAHEGFANGPKAALDWARGAGHAGKLRAIADGFDVTTGYEAALEGWLEGRLESLIADDTTVALEALAHIEDAQQGRAAIQLAALMSESTLSSACSFDEARRVLTEAGFSIRGTLADFVRASGTAANLISSVCVVDSLEPLAALLPAEGPSRFAPLWGWSLVDVQGRALDSGGALRGGSVSYDQTASFLGRKRAIAELAEQIAAAEGENARLDAAVADARRALELSRARLQTLQSELQALEIEAAAMDRDVHQADRACRETDGQLEIARHEAAETRADAERMRADREEAEGKMAAIQAGRAELESRIEHGEHDVADRMAATRALEHELNALRVTEAQRSERALSLRRELDAGRSLAMERERRLAEVVRVLERGTRERDEHAGGDLQLETRIEELTRALAAEQEALALVKDRLEQAGAKLNAALERIKEAHASVDRKSSETSQLAVDAEKASGELAHLVQNLEEKYGPGCLERPVTSPIQEEMEAPVVTAEMTAEEEQLLGEEVERLRERIRRLGEVNPSAVEEYEEVKKRHDYLIGEKGDLERSITNLQEAIEHINKTSEDRFKKAFEAIADRFERLFPIIFGGGSAHLSLVYPEGSTDILEAGVDILAQPPGKKVSNITLLSGGEKALTAVSLIFSIFMVKPSPFCLLDEVDAPLDDANIGKFNALLREMSAKSQFILITHNKKTMELNDTLYGVTMEEPGVSKIVSIEMH